MLLAQLSTISCGACERAAFALLQYRKPLVREAGRRSRLASENNNRELCSSLEAMLARNGSLFAAHFARPTFSTFTLGPASAVLACCGGR